MFQPAQNLKGVVVKYQSIFVVLNHIKDKTEVRKGDGLPPLAKTLKKWLVL